MWGNCSFYARVPVDKPLHSQQKMTVFVNFPLTEFVAESLTK